MVELFDASAQWQNDIHGSLLIEASAGTGKTFTIGNLYLRHVLSGKTPSEILVVSFTNAAVDELKIRIRRRLAAACQLFEGSQVDDAFLNLLASQIEQSDPLDRDAMQLRLQLALRSMDEAAIFTIHGFCQVALNEFALLGNHHFEQQIITNDDDLWDQALKDWWRFLCYPMPGIHWHLLLMSDISLAAISQTVRELKRHRTQRFIPDNIPTLATILECWESYSESLQQLGTEWQTQRESIREVLANSSAISQAKTSGLAKNALPRLFTVLDDYFEGANPLLFPKELWHLSTSGINAASKTTRVGKDATLDLPFFKTVQQIRDNVVALQKALRRRLQLDAYGYCLERVKQLKHRNNQVSFDDQIERLLEALRSVSGNDLAERLSSRFPVAMIDEFQDTDDAQYELFKRIYQGKTDTCLGLIGDPKQSIYGFRGADIFTYIRASQEPQIQHYALQTNWRSDPDLIDAVNSLFAHRDDAFVFGESIPFLPARAAERPRTDQLLLSGEQVSPLTLWQLPVADNGKALSNKELLAQINNCICAEIKTLLSNGRIDGKPVASGDIAILVRSSWQGEVLREVMLSNGLNAISIGKQSIFASQQAVELLQLLEAIASPTEDGLARRAISNGLFAMTYQQLVAVLLDDQQWQQWTAKLMALHERWRSAGFVAMFTELLHGLNLLGSVAVQPQAERKLTNLLHLGDLLINQSKTSPGMEALLAWLSRQLELPDNDESELRLESEESLIKIITIHKSKGLEYPIVFLPYAWDGRYTDREQSFFRFHDQQGRAVVDLDSEEKQAHWLLADRERLAEDLRLLYVALTRARSKLYVAYGHAGMGGRKTQAAASALSWLIAAGQSADALQSDPVKAYEDSDELARKLNEFTSQQTQIELRPLEGQSAESAVQFGPPARFEGEVRTFHRQFSVAWKINSFSGLTRDIHQTSHIDQATVSTDPIFNFEAGSHVGLLLHALLEGIDFGEDVATQAKPLIDSLAADFGIRATEQGDVLLYWLEQIIKTPLDGSGLQLTMISNDRRLNELSFDYPVGFFQTERINDLFQQYSNMPVPPIGANDFTGMMTGSIDLIFEYQGRFYLADYKSNLLGKTLADYSLSKLEQAMIERRYDLQMLIYSVALHRYLRQRLPSYDYEQHFGGCYYLFLRGMRIEQGHQYGSYFHRPDLSFIEKLDQLLSTGSYK